MWREGVALSPDGEARQIPTKYTWASTYWITRDGNVTRRHYDFQRRRWHWDEEPVMPVEEVNSRGDSTGRLGIYIDGWWKSLELYIALAWIPRQEESTAPVQREAGMPLHKRHLSWSDGGEGHMEEPRTLRGETWRPLVWRCGCVPCPDTYQISNFGRIRSPTGVTSRGFWFDDRRWEAIKGAGLVDLFAAAKLRRVLNVPPRIRTTLDALMSGQNPRELARVLGIAEDSAWTYAWETGCHIPSNQLWRIARNIVSVDLLDVLRDMEAQGHPLLGARLTELMSEVEDNLPEDSEFHDEECQFGMLKFAHMALQSQA
jgi:hypothetical protein